MVGWCGVGVCRTICLLFIAFHPRSTRSSELPVVNVCRQLTAAAHVLGQEHPETRTEIGLSVALGRA